VAELEKWLALPAQQLWSEAARSELRAARAPVSQVDDEGLDPFGPSQIVRWLCHRALPYPGMLLSDLYAAWALGISADEFRALVNRNADTEWTGALDEVQYGGPLDAFLGRRWWKAGIDHLVWRLDEETLRQRDRRKAWSVLAPGIEFSQIYSVSTHVVSWSAELLESAISDINECVQLRPPGWPAEALEPWILRKDLENDSTLAAMADEE
jgi:hypothetical protein